MDIIFWEIVFVIGKILAVLVILFVGIAAYSMLINTDFQPLGRLAFVKNN